MNVPKSTEWNNQRQKHKILWYWILLRLSTATSKHATPQAQWNEKRRNGNEPCNQQNKHTSLLWDGTKQRNNQQFPGMPKTQHCTKQWFSCRVERAIAWIYGRLLYCEPAGISYVPSCSDWFLTNMVSGREHITQLLSLPWIVNGSVAATKAENDRGELAGRQVVYHPCATTWIIRRRNPSDGCVLIRSSWMGYTNTPFSKRNAASQKVSAAAISGLRRQDGKFLSFFIHASYGS